MNEWYPEEEEEGNIDKGMVHLKVVWEETSFFFSRTSDWCQLLTLFYIKIYEKDEKKINYYIELLCIIRSFLLNNLILLLVDCTRCGKV